jgi:hypothetical protein
MCSSLKALHFGSHVLGSIRIYYVYFRLFVCRQETEKKIFSAGYLTESMKLYLLEQ